MRTPLAAAAIIGAQLAAAPPHTLPPAATSALASSLTAAGPHPSHVWRDGVPMNDDGTVNAYIEIPRGERLKFELDIARNVRRVDRVMPASLGGYPVNYGIVPQTISFDGDPFDALVLGPPLVGGATVRGVIVGIMHMEDEKGVDSKVVLSPVDRNGGVIFSFTDADRRRIGRYFDAYKQQPGTFSRVTGWEGPDAARAWLAAARRFFAECRDAPGRACTLDAQ